MGCGVSDPANLYIQRKNPFGFAEGVFSLKVEDLGPQAPNPITYQHTGTRIPFGATVVLSPQA